MRRILYLIIIINVSGVFAHGALHDQIGELSHQIEMQSDNADLYIKRGQVYLEDGKYTEAYNDFRKSLNLEKNARSARYFLGQASLKLRRYDEAQQHVNVFLDSLSGEPGALTRGYRLLGEIHVARQDLKNAAQAYQAAIVHAEDPRPDFYLDLANVYMQLGNSCHEAAINALDQGMQRLGALAVLQDRLVQVNLAAGKHDAALKQLDGMIAHGQRLPGLYETRAGILHDLGRDQEAMNDYRLALAELDHLPVARRNSRVMSELRKSILNAMMNIETDEKM